MITLRRAKDRRRAMTRDRDAWMTFLPRETSDPFAHGFRALRALNEEHLGPEKVLVLPAEEDVDVIVYVLEGTLILQGRSGRRERLESGEFQAASVRGWSRGRTWNGSASEGALVFQGGFAPGAAQDRSIQERKRFPRADREGVLQLVVSPDGGKGSLRLAQDVRLYSSILLPGDHLIHEMAAGRGAWLQVVQGAVALLGHELGVGDGAALEGEPSVAVTARGAAEILLFDLA